MISNEFDGLKTRRRGIDDETLPDLVEAAGNVYVVLDTAGRILRKESDNAKDLARITTTQLQTALGQFRTDYGEITPYERLRNEVNAMGEQLAEKFGFEYEAVVEQPTGQG